MSNPALDHKNATTSATAEASPAESKPEAMDEAILEYMFNPGLQGIPVAAGNMISDDELGPPAPEIDPGILDQLKALEKEGVQLAEDKQITDAIAKFTEAVELCPTYASAYNNRAQAHQLNKDPDAALEDLNKAVELAGRDRSVLKQALSQRGSILKARGKEEEARKDFEFAGKLGSTFAKVEAVNLNPYAALCNKFLTQALKEHQEALPKEWKSAAEAIDADNPSN